MALQAGRSVWLIDSDGGVPLHVFTASQTLGFDDTPEFVAFADSPDRMWVNIGGAPALIDLAKSDRIFGPFVSMAWVRDAPFSPFDSWAYSSQSVASDGTLIWTSWEGRTRALAVDGGVRWDRDAVAGPATLDPNGTAYWAGATAIGRASADGALVWVPRVGASWEAITIPIDEGSPIPRFIPVTWRDPAAPSGIDGVLGFHDSVTGALVASLHENDGGLIHPIGRVTTASDETFFVSGSRYLPQEATDATYISAYGPQRQRLWTVRTPHLPFAPIAGQRSDRLFTVTGDCRVNVVDRQGNTLASHQMVGHAQRFVPKLVDGVLYVLAETTVPAEIRAGDIKFRADGGIISARVDYECFAACPPIEEGPFYVLYAFQVE